MADVDSAEKITGPTIGSNDKRVGLIYDERMCKHSTPDGESHPENPNRIRAIWNKLLAAGIPQRCAVLDAKEAEDKYLVSVHSKNHVKLIKNISTKKFDARRNRTASTFNSIYLNDGSSEAAYLAAGSVIEAAERVASGELDSAFAIVRPPGHHAEKNEPMGFCLYNNVAIAASFLLNERPELGIGKILIVDWDVHHGNGTQKMFWNDPRVLFFSVHRHEFGNFYPANDDGDYTMIGGGAGVGYNINVPWENGCCGDADYLAVWEHILIPVARDFKPDLIIVSAGFDAAVGDPLGGCCITPYGYSVMLNQLMGFAQGKIVMALEGGYYLDSLAKSALACVEVLLENKPIIGCCEADPFESTWRVIKMVRQQLSAFWPILTEELPNNLPISKTPAPMISLSSDSESDNGESSQTHENIEGGIEDIIKHFVQLKVEQNVQDEVASVPSWRSQLSKVDVWYATFGSNMWKPRLLCYLGGGQVEGMKRSCSGSKDRSPPKETIWKIVPHRLFFGRESTLTWGPGGVAFLHPETNPQEKAYVCLHKITLEQFNDVLLQENIASYDMTTPLLDLSDLDSIMEKRCNSVEALKKGWYHNVVYLGSEQDIPILTMTCDYSAIESFKSGEIPLRPPCEEYVNTLVRGLVEGNQLSADEALAYIKEASSLKL